MRPIVLLCCAAVLVGCGGGDDAPAADTTAVAPAAPTLALSDVAGKWHARVMSETSDSVLVEYDLTATADTAGWMMMLPNRPPMAMRVTAGGDSIVAEAGPYESVLRAGVTVSTRSVMRLQGGELVGVTTARYQTATGDSVVMLRSRAVRVP